MARRLRAEAFTVGDDIAFAPGRFRPHTAAGRGLLAHELAHVAQQRASGKVQVQRQPAPDQDDQTDDETTVKRRITRPQLELFKAFGMFGFPGIPLPRFSYRGTDYPDPRRFEPTNIVHPEPVKGSLSPFGPTLIGRRTREGVSGALAGDLVLGRPTAAEGIPLEKGHRPSERDILAYRAQTPYVSATPSGVGAAFGLSVPSSQPRRADPLDLRVTASVVHPRLHQTGRGLEVGGAVFGRVTLPHLASFGIDADVFVRRDRVDRALLPLGLPDDARARLVDRLFEIAIEQVDKGIASLRSGSIVPLELATLPGRIESEIRSAASKAPPEAIAAAALAVGRELARPGFEIVGRGRVLVFPGYARFHAPTTRSREQPLEGAPTSFPSSFLGAGVTVVRPGAVATTAAPAFGLTGFRFGERLGGSISLASVPTLSEGGLPELRSFAEAAGSVGLGRGFTLGATGAVNLDANPATDFGNLRGGEPAPTFGELIRIMEQRRAQAQGARATEAATSLFTLDPTLRTARIDDSFGRPSFGYQFHITLTKRF